VFSSRKAKKLYSCGNTRGNIRYAAPQASGLRSVSARLHESPSALPEKRRRKHRAKCFYGEFGGASNAYAGSAALRVSWWRRLRYAAPSVQRRQNANAAIGSRKSGDVPSCVAKRSGKVNLFSPS
jgi:hypothetical protein